MPLRHLLRPAAVIALALASCRFQDLTPGGSRIVRTEPRPDGEVATDRVVVVARSGHGRREYEATDVFTISRRAGAWRVAHAVFGPWRSRSAP